MSLELKEMKILMLACFIPIVYLQAAYPPNHYIRRVPQRKIHQFTGCQVMQLLVMCLFGFAPWAYMKMVFPLIILFLLPVRHRLVPKLIEARFLEALDGEHQ